MVNTTMASPGLLFVCPISTSVHGAEGGCEPLVVYDVSGNGIDERLPWQYGFLSAGTYTTVWDSEVPSKQPFEGCKSSARSTRFPINMP